MSNNKTFSKWFHFEAYSARLTDSSLTFSITTIDGRCTQTRRIHAPASIRCTKTYWEMINRDYYELELLVSSASAGYTFKIIDDGVSMKAAFDFIAKGLGVYQAIIEVFEN